MKVGVSSLPQAHPLRNRNLGTRHKVVAWYLEEPFIDVYTEGSEVIWTADLNEFPYRPGWKRFLNGLSTDDAFMLGVMCYRLKRKNDGEELERLRYSELLH